MGKSFVVIAASAGLLLALAASAEAGGRRTFTSGTTFAPPGLTSLPQGAKQNGKFGSFTDTTTNTTISTPSGWQSNPGWGASLGGSVPPGLRNPPGR